LDGIVPTEPAPAGRAQAVIRPHVDASFEPDPAGYVSLFNVIDRALHANIARYTFGLSPRAMTSAYVDWLDALAFSPGKQAQLIHKAQRKALRLQSYLQDRLANPTGDLSPCIEPLPQDRRFADPAWRRPPFDSFYQGFLLTQQWWHNATTGLAGITAQNERAVEFAARQLLDIFSPSNFVWTNPTVLEATVEQGGRNLYEGWRHFVEDVQTQISGSGPVGSEHFRAGQEVAVTPGKVVYRNRLIELIQYTPTTDKVYAEPILITPAWIMKYYILDLSPGNSLVKFLVDNGHTVFMISWKNPAADDRDLALNDYLSLGPMAALEAIERIAPGKRVHAAGYCLGGTLLAIAAAALARDGDDRLASLTFLATQIDFADAGELMLFINEKQIAFLEDLMWEQGFLDSSQMAGAFQILRSNDLIWSRMVRDYLLGVRMPVNDLMAWNADGTRMPYRMHSDYLERLFLHNDFSEGRYKVNEEPVILSDVRAPMFVVATERDHVAPWRSVYKFHVFSETDLTFLLTSGGHNAGIVAPPGQTQRTYRVARHLEHDPYVDADIWLERNAVKQGSWWTEWLAWLDARSGEKSAPPSVGEPSALYLADAPGAYVLMS
jgi:polyhydroxyalkanoate synthase